MNLTRRDSLKLMALAGSATILPASAQTSSSRTRIPLHEFVQDQSRLDALRKGVAAMKARPPSDPFSWFFQGAIHGAAPSAIAQAVSQDPNVANVDQAKFWSRCPHGGDFHSADFLPWHRAYTHYFERILAYHTGLADFALPYWDYSDKSLRKFPREFGVKHLNGNIRDDSPENINPLYHPERDEYLTSYEHPFAVGLPYLELSDSAVDASAAMAAGLFFGASEREGLGGWINDSDGTTRGLLETSPHDPIHRVVGGIIASAFDANNNPIGFTHGAMATPPTAAFDPIFCVHHSNIDRLWAEWSLIPGKQWGVMPPGDWFDAAPWFFYDIEIRNGVATPVEVNLPRKNYFNHRSMGIRFKSEDLTRDPLELPQTFILAANVAPAATPVVIGGITERHVANSLMRSGRTVGFEVAQPLKAAATPKLGFQPGPAGLSKRVLLRLKNVDLGFSRAVGFDVHVTGSQDSPLNRSSPSFVGSVTLFGLGGHDHHQEHGDHAGHDQPASGGDQLFDATKALATIAAANEQTVNVVFVPYPLAIISGGGEFVDPTPMIVDAFEFVEQQT
jgi:hypothetical protein